MKKLRVFMALVLMLGLLMIAINSTNVNAQEPAPDATQPAPTDPAPTDPAPTDPAPTDPAPTDPAPAPTDPAPAPTDPAPTDPAPAEPAPAEPAPAEPAPAEPAPAEPAPAEPAPAEPEPEPESERAAPVEQPALPEPEPEAAEPVPVAPTAEAGPVTAEVSAAAIPALTSGFQLQNLGTTVANIAISFYDQSGALVASPSDTITAGGSKTYFPLSAVSSGFNGSVVVQSSQNLAGIVNLLGVGGAGSLSGGASYDSISVGASTVNLPLVLRNVFNINSFINVQNTSSTAANVTVTYPGTGCSQTQNIPGNSSKTFDQNAASMTGCPTGLPNGFVGSAQATGGNLVATVVEYDPDSLLAYNGFGGGATNPVMPLLIGNFVNTDTGIQIQNAGSTATSVTLSYTPAGSQGNACTETQTINPGQSANFGVGNVFPATSACLAGTGGSPNPAKGIFVGGAAVTTNSTNQPLVAIVNQATIGGANSSAYGGFNPGVATSKVGMPLIVKDLPLSGGFNLFTGFNIANVGAAPATVNCTFSGQATTVNLNIPVGGVVNSVQTGGASGLPANYVGSATCTGASSDKIVAVVNEVGGAGDSLLTYEGFNQ